MAEKPADAIASSFLGKVCSSLQPIETVANDVRIVVNEAACKVIVVHVYYGCYSADDNLLRIEIYILDYGIFQL